MKLIPSDSSLIEAHAYDPQTQTLRLKFRNGDPHDYSGITPEMYADFRSGSHGKFFHARLKGNGKHPCCKVEK